MGLKERILLLLSKLDGIHLVARKCLKTERWNGNVCLMVLDAAITSTGVNYFQVVIPKVKEFEREFVRSGMTPSLLSLSNLNFEEVCHIWRNIRSIHVAREIAGYLSTISSDDRQALREWAKRSALTDWKNDPIGRIRGVGLVTYQYLRMMGGVDTVMPDKIVKKVLNELLIQAGEEPIISDFDLIKNVEDISRQTGRLQTEICFMTWFVKNPEKIKFMP